jgi:hypothetical protein
MANITYKRTFQHEDWIDNEDVVQAGGEKGFNVKFRGLETEFDNISGVIAKISAGLGAFQPVGVGGVVAYAGGNVGIGSSFSTTNPPTYLLEVNLGPNTATTEQVRFGNVVCSNGVGITTDYAVVSHQNQASNINKNYALRQSPDGEVNINAPSGQSVSIRQNGTNVRLLLSSNGNVIVGSESDQGGGILQVNGDACKTSGGANWSVCSDVRLKENVRDLEIGLAELRRVRPVRFRYNGKAGTPAGQESVGVLGQEIEMIFPEMVRRVACSLDSERDTEDLRIYDGSALTFVLVNAVKELAQKVEQLEQTLAEFQKN